ncbi:hypothetical protein FNF29_01636 [Cafeteria roenbergensis]|uniref:Chloride channel protein n=1 Tax=Cafeteria roenbergensis TaxID=33653 RepID=A0A5A8CV81_CAFRO|nr:hypothetical protein FNF29_01636 [Cafeteria roenbergensis]|eukprot:KAA0155721.1 hypothetical protein FNF29_01636 [Cafeteria roenbergensis]
MAVTSSARAFLTEIRDEIASSGAATRHAGGMHITDMYASRAHDELEGEVQRVEEAEAETRAELAAMRAAGRAGCLQVLRARMRMLLRVFADTPSTILFLSLVGATAALGGAAVDGIVGSLLGARASLQEAAPPGLSGWPVAALWACFFAMLAVSVGHLLTERAEGSGIPQVKAILAGTWLHKQLSLPTLGAKTIGLIAALASGLFVGKEGPFVHMAATAAAKLWRLPCFSGVRRSDTLKRQALAAAVAAGVTATLGAPMGGVIFSVEATATYYQVSSLWRGVLCSLVCVFVFEALQALADDQLFQPTEFGAPDMSWQLIAFAALGVACGLVASAMVRLTAAANLARRSFLRRCSGPWARYALACVVALAVSAASSSAPALGLSDRNAINSLFQDKDGYTAADDPALRAAPPGQPAPGLAPPGNSSLTPASDASAGPLAPVWGEGAALVFTLLAFVATRAVLIPVSIALPIPSGLFTPIFAMGAALGRLAGELLLLMAPGANIEPGAFAVVGAAALTAGVTQTLSVALIVFELTQQIHHMLPVLVAVVAAYLTASLFTVSVYDALMAVAGLPYLPRLRSARHYALRACDVMRPPPALALDEATPLEVAALLAVTNGAPTLSAASSSSSSSASSSSSSPPSCCSCSLCNSSWMPSSCCRRVGSLVPAAAIASLRAHRNRGMEASQARLDGAIVLDALRSRTDDLLPAFAQPLDLAASRAGRTSSSAAASGRARDYAAGAASASATPAGGGRSASRRRADDAGTPPVSDIPVVDSLAAMRLLGTVARGSLESALERRGLEDLGAALLADAAKAIRRAGAPAHLLTGSRRNLARELGDGEPLRQEGAAAAAASPAPASRRDAALAVVPPNLRDPLRFQGLDATAIVPSSGMGEAAGATSPLASPAAERAAGAPRHPSPKRAPPTFAVPSAASAGLARQGSEDPDSGCEGAALIGRSPSPAPSASTAASLITEPGAAPPSSSSAAGGAAGGGAAQPHPAIPADPAPMEVHWLTPLPKAHYLLATCVFSQLLVTKRGRLAGVIFKDDLASPGRLDLAGASP